MAFSLVEQVLAAGTGDVSQPHRQWGRNGFSAILAIPNRPVGPSLTTINMLR
jgi:hypothetical protein